MDSAQLNVGICQISPVWLNKEKSIEKIMDYLHMAAANSCDLVVFGECLLPGYPFWLELTGGAVFNSEIQKDIYAHYFSQSVEIERGDLRILCKYAKDHNLAIYLGVLERAADRGNHSLYCSLVYINEHGIICSSHRKLMPTYEERLVWAIGDGHGLQVHSLKEFQVGGLNCWENWMPLTRAALYALGENVHIAVWPGNERNTRSITPHIAMESRSFAISVSGFLSKEDITGDIPHLDKILENAPEFLADGGSCVAGPDGSWIQEPVTNREYFSSVTLDMHKVWKERQNFDPSGHYARPDVLKLQVNQQRQKIVEFK